MLDALDACPREALNGAFWRVCRAGRDPLQAAPSQSRWCDGSFDVLYMSSERDGAIAEVHALLAAQPVFPSQVAWSVHRLTVRTERTLRLADLDALAALGVDVGRYRERDYARTQAIAEAAYFLGFDGLVAPGARWTCHTIALFAGRLAPESLAVEASEPEPVDVLSWRRRQRAAADFDRPAAALRASLAGRSHTPAEDLLREGRDER